MLVLASQSPRRQALLRSTGIEFRVVVPRVAEVIGHAPRGSPARLAQAVALAKAQWVAGREPGLVLGADTIVVCDQELLGKPTSRSQAIRMLRTLSGRWHRVYTGIALVEGTRTIIGYERTEVALRPLSKREIDWYVSTGEPMDKAGGYAIQGEGAGLVRAIRGCYTNVIGLPLPKLMEMLAALRRGGRGESESSRRSHRGW
jgi:septum formation protein